LTQTSSLRIAHLSDVHLPPPDRVPLRTLFNKRALSVVSWRRVRSHHHRPEILSQIVADIAAHAPDLIAVTGDLTNFGLPSEYAAAARWLSALPAPARAIMGNHDMMTAIDWRRGPALWSQWMAEDAASFPVVTRMGPVALISVNSGVPSLPTFATGRVGREQAARLTQTLAALGRENVVRIVMIHHPPVRGLVRRRKALDDMRSFQKALRQGGAELVLHGHSHVTTHTTIPKSNISVQGVASASFVASHGRFTPHRAAAWNQLDITQDGPRWSIHVTTRAMDADGVIRPAHAYRIAGSISV